MVVDHHHEVVNGVGAREQADLAADGSISFLLVMEILGIFVFRSLPTFFFFLFCLRRATDDVVVAIVDRHHGRYWWHWWL